MQGGTLAPHRPVIGALKLAKRYAEVGNTHTLQHRNP
jgi:hypothetical protein